MISLLMTAGVMDFAATLVLDITKQIYTVGKRFSMVANLDFKQLKISVEKMSAILMLPRANLSHFHR